MTPPAGTLQGHTTWGHTGPGHTVPVNPGPVHTVPTGPSCPGPIEAVVDHTVPAGTVGSPRSTAPAGAPGGLTDAVSRRLRFAALGDSLTAGVGDPVPDAGRTGWRGWAALLGESLARTGGSSFDVGDTFRNFAASGALTRDVDETQTPAALDFRPDIASVLIGVNDTLRGTFDIQDIARRLDRVCGEVVGHGAVLLTACLPDPGTMLGLPVPLGRPLARRQRAVNTVVHALSERYEAIHLHMSDPSWVLDRSLWSADRLHPGERGHRAIAARFHCLLEERGLDVGPAPPLDVDQPVPTRAAVLFWLATQGTGWVARRCTDLLPALLRLAGTEIRHWVRGNSARLDLQAEQALSGALATLVPGVRDSRIDPTAA